MSFPNQRYSNKKEAIKAILDQPMPSNTTSSDSPLKSEQFAKPCSPTINTRLQASGYAEHPIISNISTPLGLLEEVFSDNPWKLMISAIFLNRTSRVQVDTVLFQFLQKWPTALAASQANPEVMAQLIRPLGFANKRAEGVVRFSKEYLELLERKEKECEETTGATNTDNGCACRVPADRNLSKEDLLGLYQCGDYVAAAYQIFIQRNWATEHQDHALTWYVDYQRACRTIPDQSTSLLLYSSLLCCSR